MMINSAVKGRLNPTGSLTEDYLSIELNIGPEKHITTITAGYIPATGGLVTSANRRTGRIKVIGGKITPLPGIQLDPFSPDIELQGEQFVFIDQIINNQIIIPFNGEGLVIPAGIGCTIIIGASVGEADSSSSPSASYGYLTCTGYELVKGNRLITNMK